MLGAIAAFGTVIVLAVVGASDATVIVAAIMGATAVICELLRRQGVQQRRAATNAQKAVGAAERAVNVAQNAAQAIGTINGHGDLSTAVSTIIARLDAQDRASAEERRLRDEGKDRAMRMLDGLDELRRAQADFITRDEVHDLRTAIDRVAAMIGEPEPDWDPTPLLPYVHKWRHDFTNEVAKAQAVMHGLVERAVAALAEAHRVLDAAVDQQKET